MGETPGSTGVRDGARPPQYAAIRDDMVARVLDGRWQRGKAIPPLKRLQDLYPASRATILRATHLLEEVGYLRVEHGRGTFVQHRLPGRRIGILCGDNIFSVPPPPFAAAVCDGLRRWLEAEGYEPRIYVVEDYHLADTCYPNHALALDVKRDLLAGLALVSTDALPEVIRDARARGLPLVDLGANLEHPAHMQLDLDDIIVAGVAWLALHGRREIGLISGGDARADLFRARCTENGVRTRDEWIRNVGPAGCEDPVGDAMTGLQVEAQGFLTIRRLWQLDERPDALVVTDDIVAKGVAQGLLALGVRVPEDMLLVAAGNSRVPIFYPTPLVRYEFDTDEIVAATGRTLVRQLNGRPPGPLPRISGRLRETGLFTL